LISKKGRGSLAKWPAEGVRADLSCWILIPQLRSYWYAVLISYTCYKSDDSGLFGSRSAAERARVLILRRRVARACRTSPFLAIRASIRLGFGSGSTDMRHVHHLCCLCGATGYWAACAASGAVRQWRSSPACAHSHVARLDQDATGPVCVCKAKAYPNKGHAVPGCAVEGPPRWSSGVCRRRPVFRPPG
jgi:hypothetical protein